MKRPLIPTPARRVVEFFVAFVIVLCLLVLTTAPARAGPDRVSFLAASHHFDASIKFTEINPGLFLTWEGPRADLTAGLYRNSYGRLSLSALAAVPLVRWPGGQLAIFGGVALYPVNGRNFRAHIGDLVPMGGLQIRHKNLFAQLIPSDGRHASAIVAAGLTFALPR